ncbi:curli assembly protein CsgF [Kushneria aurantia]|uniref:Curli production assembly/transport component CsgF n=1 Tax=Kushneria aurantia TaxID=504092 RepID=A0ABV6FZN6_9GAMM|nr:curli assembly protein CsgF [Kushneria aurantia]
MNGKRNTFIGALLGGALTIAGSVQAGDLVYRPINPTFGGDPLAGNYLLNKAQAQDNNKDPDAPGRQSFSATDRLVQSLQSRLISQLLGDISTGKISEGSFESTDFSVTIQEQNDLINLRITDKTTGDVTDIQVGGLFNP